MLKLNSQIRYTAALMTFFAVLGIVFTISAKAEIVAEEIFVLDSVTLLPIARAYFSKQQKTDSFTLNVQPIELGEETSSAEKKFVVLDSESEKLIKWLPFDPFYRYEALDRGPYGIEPYSDLPSKIGYNSLGAEIALTKNKRVIVGVGTVKFVIVDGDSGQPNALALYKQIKDSDGIQGYIRIRLGKKKR